MERQILKKLIDWKQSKYRKPLILKGARQVGKTYILKQFGEKNYEGVAYFNFDHDKDLYNLFENTKDPKRILEQLAFIYGKAIKPEKTLIIFDEIQECPNALNSLKYFQEEANEYHIACAGSLLGIRLSHTSFPVGKVEFLNMYPMSFTEFLKADNVGNLVDYMESINEIQNIPEIFQNQLEEKLKAYFIIGGMPEAVNSWTNFKDMEQVNKIQDDILKAYETDIDFRIHGFEKANENGYKVETTDIQPGIIYQDDRVTVEAFPVSHGTLESYGFKFTTPDKVIVISGDTAPLEIVAQKAEGCDILLHEVEYTAGLSAREPKWQKYHQEVHTLSVDLAKIAAKAHPRLLVTYHRIYHMEIQDNTRDVEAEMARRNTAILQEIRDAGYEGAVVNGQDLDVF